MVGVGNAVAMLAMVTFAFPSLAFAAARLIDWTVIGGLLLAVIGVAAMSRWSSGPFPTWLKRGLVIVLLFEIVGRLTLRSAWLRWEEPDNYLEVGVMRSLEWVQTISFWTMGYTTIVLAGFSAAFCARWRLWGAGFGWGALAISLLSATFFWAVVSPLTLLAVPVLVVASPLLTARSLRLYIRELSKQTA